MGPSRKGSNGRSPLVNPQRQITSFFCKATSSSPSSVSTLSKERNPNPNPKPSSPGPITPSPVQSKTKKPLLVIGKTPSPSPSPSTSTPGVITKSYGKEVVEKRIRVYWPLDKSWYEGCIKSYDEDSGKHLVQYDDFEEEVLDLGKEKIEWVEESVKKFKRLRRGSLAFKKTVIEDEEMKDVLADVEQENVGGDGDDSSDEDWGKNVEKDVSEEEDVDLEDEVVEDYYKGVKSDSRKRKANGAAKLASVKKKMSCGDVSEGALKFSVGEPVKDKGSMFLHLLAF